ncbi:MAG: uridine kinase [Elusimicrobiota bacterium]|nr:uridine kinase [Elusimicrobiota bacterium]
MPKTKGAKPQVVLGIAGGSGSGKSWLAHRVATAFAGRSTLLCHDWWYRDNGHLPHEEALLLNVDHPDSLETDLMCRDLDRLMLGEAIEAPVYDYAKHARLKRTRTVEPAPLVIIDGILILADSALRERLTLSVFIEVPDDIRLARRVRRDTAERGVAVEETLRVYEHCVRPMHKEFVAPSSHHATWIWSQLEDAEFPDLLLADLAKRLAPEGAAEAAPAA